MTPGYCIFLGPATSRLLVDHMSGP